MSSRPSRVGERGILPLWFGFAAGALGWTAHLLLSYALLPVACGSGSAWILHGVTLGTLLLTALGGLVAYRHWRSSPPEQPGGTRGRDTGYGHYMALCGVLLNVLFGFAIVLEGLPVAILSPCW